jgi:hypothetical protein
MLLDPLAPIHAALDDLARCFDRPQSCPDVVARLRADIADLPKPRQRLRDFIECNDAEGECFALVPYLVPHTSRVDDTVFEEVARKYAEKFGVSLNVINHDMDTDIISAGDRILGCLSVVTR